MASIRFENVTKAFEGKAVIESLNLNIEDGKFTVLVGPSGCGKTTLLRMIAGIGPESSGSIFIGDKDVTDIPPSKRSVAMVFQNYALYPTMNVKENIEFGLKNNGVKKKERSQLVNNISKAVGLSDYLTRKPATLSGGQRQRVALARAMVKQPSVFLMDEPLSNLDAKLRVQMRLDLIELHKNLGSTFVYVTHDQVEAMSMADTIILMNDGEIQQEDSPDLMYKDPNNLFVAQFLGVPPMNIIDIQDNGGKFGFRPEAVIPSIEELDYDFSIKGEVMTREMLGSETLYQVRNGDAVFMIKCSEDRFETGQYINCYIPFEKIYYFDSDGGRVRENHADHQEYVKALRRYDNGQKETLGIPETLRLH